MREVNVPFRIKVHGAADGTPFPEGYWIESYDVDTVPKVKASTFNADGTVTIHGVHGGRITLTKLPEKALQFPSTAEAFKAWNTVSLRVPRRPDGKWNKPLTALTVEVEPCE